MRASVRQSFCRSTVSIVVIALAIVAAFALVPQAQAGELIAAQSTGTTSNFALLKANGYLVPCSSSGVEISDTWEGNWSSNTLDNVHTIIVAADVAAVTDEYAIKFAESVRYGGEDVYETTRSFNSRASGWSWPSGGGLPKLSVLKFMPGATCLSIAASAFNGVNTLSTVSLSDSVRSIGDNAFRGCTSLSEVDFGSSLRSIGMLAFGGCSSLTEIDLPASFSTVNTKYYGSFKDSGLAKVTLRSSNLVADGQGSKSVWKAFENTPIVEANNNAYIYVPTAALTAYRTHYGTDGKDGDGWSYFGPNHLDKLRGIDGEPTSITGATITVSPTSYIYDGAAKRPSVTVRYGSATLVNGKQYAASYKNNVNAGTATVVVTGIGLYAGTITKTFTINKAEQPMGVTGKTAKVKRSKKAKMLAASKVLYVSNARGVVSYKKLSGNKKISINSKTGKVTVKGGLKKKVYKVVVKVIAAGNGNYYGSSKIVTFKVKVA